MLELERYIEFLQFQTERRHSLEERLAKDQGELATSYDELAWELSGEVWLIAENEALYRVEKDTGVQVRVQRGDIFLANLDPLVGVERAGTLPVLVVQCHLSNERIPTVTVVPLTSSARTARFLFTVAVTAAESGLSADSVILVFHVRTLDKARLIRRMGHLQTETMSRVDQAPALHLGLTLPQPVSPLKV